MLREPFFVGNTNLVKKSFTVLKIFESSFIESRFNAPVKLSTRYTTPDIVLEIGSAKASVGWSKPQKAAVVTKWQIERGINKNWTRGSI